MRYYYDDPLEAAWMAQHFGMSFEGYDEIEIDRYEILSAALKPHDMRINYTVPSIFIIRFDSQHLLEPQVGDLVSINGGESASIATHWEFCEALKANADRFVSPVQIIQRNGAAFMMPKSEETDNVPK